MDVRFVSSDGMQQHEVAELPELLARDDGIVWVDIPARDEQAESVLTDVFRFHPLAVRDALTRNQVPKVHVYPDHVFLVLHAPQAGAGGHVHYVELDQFVGDPIPGDGPRTTEPQGGSRGVDDRDEGGVGPIGIRPAAHPGRAFEVSYALLTALTARLRLFTADLTRDVWQLEQRVTGDHLADPEEFLDEMFRARHGLLTVRTMAALSREVYARMVTIQAFGAEGQQLLHDAVDQFLHLTVMADGQKEYLQGTIEFYQARTNTKMTIAAERLAVIAAITLPITALSSVLGMNVIVNESTHWVALIVLLAIMLVISLAMLVWAKRKGWF